MQILPGWLMWITSRRSDYKPFLAVNLVAVFFGYFACFFFGSFLGWYWKDPSWIVFSVKKSIDSCLDQFRWMMHMQYQFGYSKDKWSADEAWRSVMLFVWRKQGVSTRRSGPRRSYFASLKSHKNHGVRWWTSQDKGRHCAIIISWLFQRCWNWVPTFVLLRFRVFDA